MIKLESLLTKTVFPFSERQAPPCPRRSDFSELSSQSSTHNTTLNDLLKMETGIDDVSVTNSYFQKNWCRTSSYKQVHPDWVTVAWQRRKPSKFYCTGSPSDITVKGVKIKKKKQQKKRMNSKTTYANKFMPGESNKQKNDSLLIRREIPTVHIKIQKLQTCCLCWQCV